MIGLSLLSLVASIQVGGTYISIEERVTELTGVQPTRLELKRLRVMDEELSKKLGGKFKISYQLAPIEFFQMFLNIKTNEDSTYLSRPRRTRKKVVLFRFVDDGSSGTRLRPRHLPKRRARRQVSSIQLVPNLNEVARQEPV